MKKLIIASKKSELAMWQSKHIKKLIEDKYNIEEF